VRPTRATVHLDAIGHNVAALAELARPALMCAVVKADGYGHGALATARVAVESGADWLAVALVEEGIELREGGITAPILILSEPRPNEMFEVVQHDLVPAVYSAAGCAAAAAAAATLAEPLPVHLKIDTGMHRVGASPDQAVQLADAVANKPTLRLAGVWTHCAVADDLDDDYTARQLETYEAVLGELAAAGHTPDYRHAANSAVLLGHPQGHYDLVRVGIASYGLEPSRALAGVVDLRPAMDLTSEVSFVKTVAAGERISYGLKHSFETETVVATVPIGYADGVRRSYARHGGEVLIGGERRPVVGTVTMDHLMVDCGADSGVEPGAEVVLIGEQGGQRITATDVADRLGTINYEVTCDIGRRVRRVYR
jgi:alanine racemase